MRLSFVPDLSRALLLNGYQYPAGSVGLDFDPPRGVNKGPLHRPIPAYQIGIAWNGTCYAENFKN